VAHGSGEPLRAGDRAPRGARLTATPVPRRLYVHDDLSEELRAHGDDSRVQRLGHALLALLRQDPRVILLTLEEQIDALVARAAHAPFAGAIGVGRAGARVAAEIHTRTGWFPTIERVDVWREEDDAGGYALAGPAPLAPQLGVVANRESVAVVDDTIFSGLTMRAVLTALPPRPARRLHAFCLRGVAAAWSPWPASRRSRLASWRRGGFSKTSRSSTPAASSIAAPSAERGSPRWRSSSARNG